MVPLSPDSVVTLQIHIIGRHDYQFRAQKAYKYRKQYDIGVPTSLAFTTLPADPAILLL